MSYEGDTRNFDDYPETDWRQVGKTIVVWTWTELFGYRWTPSRSGSCGGSTISNCDLRCPLSCTAQYFSSQLPLLYSIQIPTLFEYQLCGDDNIVVGTLQLIRVLFSRASTAQPLASWTHWTVDQQAVAITNKYWDYTYLFWVVRVQCSRELLISFVGSVQVSNIITGYQVKTMNEESAKYLFILTTKHFIDYLSVNSRTGY